MAAQVVGPAPKPYNAAEALASFDSIPLFMKSLPEEIPEDSALAALQSLVYDGTPDEIAQNFKTQGNEYFKGKRYREAIDFYNQGVDAKPSDIAILEALLLNRAACNLELENYGTVLRDCSMVLTTNPESSKAYYRSGQALVRLGRLAEALDCCTRCLAYDPTNEGIGMLAEKAKSMKYDEDKMAIKKEEQRQKEEATQMAMKRAFWERNLIIFHKQDGSSSPVVPHFDKEDPTEGTLIFPVFFLYPQHATSDIISEFNESTTFGIHLETMFPPRVPPPEWDKKQEYTAKNLVVYATTNRKRLLKVGKKMTMRDVFKVSKGTEGTPRDGLELKDNCLTFVVLPRGDVESRWVEEYKKLKSS